MRVGEKLTTDEIVRLKGILIKEYAPFSFIIKFPDETVIKWELISKLILEIVENKQLSLFPKGGK